MRFDWKVFFVVLPFSLAIGVLSNIHLFLLLWILGTPQYSQIVLSVDVVRFCISPLVLFASFYFMGRSIDLIAELPSILVSLFLGSLIGQLIGHFSSILLFASLRADWYFLSRNFWFFWAPISRGFSHDFFVGFGGLSASYLVQKRQIQRLYG